MNQVLFSLSEIIRTNSCDDSLLKWAFVTGYPKVLPFYSSKIIVLA